ncbi:hypothetical protein SEA_DOGGS_34 [Gordonia phage Doggs]|nr:hypothetical protein SEA_DOGGS_34 [Gordonia phage Doggs]
MTSMSAVLERRLGLKAIWEDHVSTWSDEVGKKAKRERRLWTWWFFGVPAIIAAPFLIFHVELRGLGQILAGTAVFTGLLFGLLGVVFNTGVTLRKEGEKFPNAHQLPRVVADLRSNITYATVVGIVLSMTLVIAAAVGDPKSDVYWLWTIPIVWLFAHLGLTLLMVLRRFRTAFNYVTR